MREAKVPGGHTQVSGPDRSAIRVLIVDDEEDVREFVERVLRGAGYETTTACGGPEAIDRASSLKQLDLLLTDVVMPQMSGDELARRLCQTNWDLKVLYLTGFSDELFKRKVRLWDNEAFLDKPCSIGGLLEAVSLLLVPTIPVAQVDPSSGWN